MWGFFKEIVTLIKEVFVWFVKKKKTIKEEIETAEKVNRVLDKLLQDTDGDRAYVFQFHNGDYFYTGNSIDKMTNTHEVTAKGISREQISSMSLMVAPYRSIVSGMLLSDIHAIEDVDNEPSYNTKTFFVDRGAKSVYLCVMYDHSKRPVGFIGIDFVKDKSTLNVYGKALLKQAAIATYELLVYGRIKTN